MTDYIDPFKKLEPYICEKHKVKIAGGHKCPLCFEDDHYVIKSVNRMKRGSLFCKICGRRIKHRNWQAEKCLHCIDL